MNKTINFFSRNLKEVLRDPIIYIFCLAFPIVMLILFSVLNNFTGGNTPTFELYSLLPGIITFSYSFVMLTLSLLVSKDKQTFFLKRLYSSPMKALDFIFGYALVGLITGLVQTLISIVTSFIISIILKVAFISFIDVLLLILSQIPMLIINVFLGILFGTIFTDKSAPGISSIFISLSGIVGGCWMPLDTMGGFETFCRCLPFYPSVYLGRITTSATKTLGGFYTFDNIAKLGLIPIFIFLVLSIMLAYFAFKNTMVSDN